MTGQTAPSGDIPFKFSTKAGTLECLAQYVTLSTLCDQVFASTAEWRDRREDIINEIMEHFSPRLLAVRSSAAHEDGDDNSLAGAHLTHINVSPTPEKIAETIDEVFESYPEVNDEDQILVQPMVEDVAVSGVVLTYDLDTGSPYYSVNYDDSTGRTDTVTGGAESKTILIRRSRLDALKSKRFRKLLTAVTELETITGTRELDIEFCITGTEEIYLLQVRPLAAKHQWDRIPEPAIDNALDGIHQILDSSMAPKKEVAGATTMFSDMTDWNPAEMIGSAPRPLALSLYKHLITDRVWAEARHLMGYRKVEAPLLRDFCGRPFIDVRLSLNSFLPAGIDEALSEKLVNHQIEILRETPEDHDKVEFEIAVTCRDLNFSHPRDKLAKAGFGRMEMEALETSLGAITHRALKAVKGKIRVLVETSEQLLEDNRETLALPPLERAQRLLSGSKTHGTLPFSQLARHGFIGVIFLKSLVARGVFSVKDADSFMHGIHTVAADLIMDMNALAAGRFDERELLDRYGHLRPGTYDILSWRYDEKPELYLGHSKRDMPAESNLFRPTERQRTEIEKLLKEAGYDLTPEAFLKYIVIAVQAREKAKFCFTRPLSDALAAFAEWGETVGLSRGDLSYLSFSDLKPGADVSALEEKISQARESYLLTRAIRLPHLIPNPSHIDVIRLPLGRPTFITEKSATAHTRILGSKEAPDIDGKIVMIESADPGFDWIFSHAIAGLVTKYGGANSHMAIRCAEFALPAAIGCGDRLFENLAQGKVLELNCAARKVSAH